MLELDRRQVDLHLQRVGARRRRCCARLLEHVAPERHDQPGVLGERDELERRDAAAARMVPAHQRLDGDRLAGREVHDRLVLDEQLALLQRALELVLEVVAADDRVAHLRGEDGEAALAALLGLVHGDVGVAQQLVDAACAGARRRRCRSTGETFSGFSPAATGGQERAQRAARPARPRRPRRRTRAGRARRTRRRRGAPRCPPCGPSARAARRRRAAARRRSPWPSVSLTPLKSSRSMNITATWPTPPISSASRTRCENSARLASPVSGSWLAWWVSWSCRSRSSVTACSRRSNCSAAEALAAERVEQRAVGVGEAAREAVAVGHQQHADHAVLAAQHAEHAVADAAARPGSRRRRPGTARPARRPAPDDEASARRAAASAASTGAIASRALPGPRPVRSGAAPSEEKRMISACSARNASSARSSSPSSATATSGDSDSVRLAS